MRISDSVEEATWRKEVREFLDRELPESIRIKNRSVGAVTVGGVEDSQDIKGKPEIRPGGAGFHLESGDWNVWRERLAECGWIAPAWPKEYGGAGLDIMRQFIMNEEFAEAGAPQLGGMGVSMAGPTIIVHGTEEQKQEHLPRILKGETWWCQGFSEPGSGSDLASLQTRAVRDGDDFVINGSKLWTSGAQRANWMFMLARTDTEAPKHRGITFFLMDFTSPGITVQPLVQMSGQAGFNQVFFDNVRVPARNVVGEINRGWYVGTTTLDFERSGIGSAVGIRHTVDALIKWNRESAGSPQSTVGRNPMARYELVDRYIEVNVARMLAYRVIHMQNVGQIPNMEASMAKLFMTELSQRVARTAIRTTGLYGQVWDRESEWAPVPGASPARAYVNSVGQTIAGGTSEIQRNIIAQRGLGMPRA
jgi:alkylation response protein AidB-like acyl-CoA dehydrogenase